MILRRCDQENPTPCSRCPDNSSLEEWFHHSQSQPGLHQENDWAWWIYRLTSAPTNQNFFLSSASVPFLVPVVPDLVWLADLVVPVVQMFQSFSFSAVSWVHRNDRVISDVLSEMRPILPSTFHFSVSAFPRLKGRKIPSIVQFPSVMIVSPTVTKFSFWFAVAVAVTVSSSGWRTWFTSSRWRTWFTSSTTIQKNINEWATGRIEAGRQTSTLYDWIAPCHGSEKMSFVECSFIALATVLYTRIARGGLEFSKWKIFVNSAKWSYGTWWRIFPFSSSQGNVCARLGYIQTRRIRCFSLSFLSTWPGKKEKTANETS